MKKKMLVIVMTLLMALTMIPGVAFADTATAGSANCTGECNHVAAIGDTHYETFEAAVNAAKENDTVTLLKNANGNGIIVGADNSNKNFTIDFNGHVYTVNGEQLAGSEGTKSQCFQLLKESGSITMKNGSIVADSESAAMIIQNYCNLTLIDMNLDATKGNNSVIWTLSNNCGDVKIKGETNIIAKSGQKAFDLWYGMSPSYVDGVTVTFEDDFNGKVSGEIEYGAERGATEWVDKTKLTISGNGEFSGGITMTKVLGTDEKANISITGGTFDSNVAEYISEGTILITYSDEMGNSVYDVLEIPKGQEPDEFAVECGAVAKDVNGVYYYNRDEIPADTETETIAYNVLFFLVNPSGEIEDDPANWVLACGEIYFDGFTTPSVNGVGTIAADDIPNISGSQYEAKYPGYKFIGWYEADIDENWTKVEKYKDGSKLVADSKIKEDKEYFAAWEKVDGTSTTPTTPDANKTDKADGTPKTSDDFNMTIPFALAGLALAGMAVALVARKREN